MKMNAANILGKAKMKNADTTRKMKIKMAVAAAIETKGGKKMDEKESKSFSIDLDKEKTTLLMLSAVFVLLAVQSFFLAGSLNVLKEQTANTALLTGNGSVVLQAQGSQAQGTGALDMSGWTDNEKMNYEMHGIIPANGNASQGNSSPDALQGLPSQVGGC